MYIKTNKGIIPVDDYKEIVSVQNGFDSYEDMLSQGIDIDIEEHSDCLISDEFMDLIILISEFTDMIVKIVKNSKKND